MYSDVMKYEALKFETTEMIGPLNSVIILVLSVLLCQTCDVTVVLVSEDSE